MVESLPSRMKALDSVLSTENKRCPKQLVGEGGLKTCGLGRCFLGSVDGLSREGLGLRVRHGSSVDELSRWGYWKCRH